MRGKSLGASSITLKPATWWVCLLSIMRSEVGVAKLHNPIITIGYSSSYDAEQASQLPTLLLHK